MSRPTCEQSQQWTRRYWRFHKSGNFLAFGDFRCDMCICCLLIMCISKVFVAHLHVHVCFEQTWRHVSMSATRVAACSVNGLHQVHLENRIQNHDFLQIHPCPSVNENLRTVTTLCNCNVNDTSLNTALHMKFILLHRVVSMDPQRGLVEVKPCGNAHGETPKSFTFDAVYDWKYVVHLFLA